MLLFLYLFILLVFCPHLWKQKFKKKSLKENVNFVSGLYSHTISGLCSFSLGSYLLTYLVIHLRYPSPLTIPKVVFVFLFFFFFFNLHAFLKSRIHASCLFHDCLFTQVQVFPFFPFLIWHFSYVWLWFPKRSNSLRTKIMPVKLSLSLLRSHV